MTWTDWGILVWVLLFSIHGMLRGTVAQVFGILGLFVGSWAALGVSHWLDDYWRGAQPLLVYLALRWIVAALAGMGAAALFQWWGELLGAMIRSGPLRWVDRGGGLGVGAAIGVATVALAVMTALLLAQPKPLTEHLARARTSEPLMSGAAKACSLSAGVLPGGTWLTERFRKAQRRTVAARGSSRTKS